MWFWQLSSSIASLNNVFREGSLIVPYQIGKKYQTGHHKD